MNTQDIEALKKTNSDLLLALQTIADFSDLEMQDGDAARDLAKAKLAKYGSPAAEKAAALSAPVADCGPNEVKWSDADKKRLDEALTEMYGKPDNKAAAADAAALSDPDQVPYMIVFDDADMKPEMVIGGTRARVRYEQISTSWNAHLFVKVDSNSRDERMPSARPAAANVGGLSLAAEALELCAAWIESITTEELPLWRESKVAEIRRALRVIQGVAKSPAVMAGGRKGGSDA